MLLCDDTDLLMLEPALARVCTSMASLVFVGALNISGTLLTTPSFDFADCAVRTGQIAVRADTQRTGVIMALRNESDGFWAAVPRAGQRDPTYNFGDPGGYETGLGNGTDVTVAVYTFPQIDAASYEVARDLNVEHLVLQGQWDINAARHAAALRTLAIIFRSMSALDHTVVSPEAAPGVILTYNTRYQALSDWYQKSYEQERRRLRVWIDENLDGITDTTINGAALPPQRD